MVFKKDTENKQLYKQEIMNHMLYGYTESPEPHTIDVEVLSLWDWQKMQQD